MSLSQPIIDSAMSFEEAIAGTGAPDEVRRALSLIAVRYLSFDGALHEGQIVVHESLAADIRIAFGELRARSFPIAKAIPIVHYDWDDEASMQDNNSSAFNYRPIAGTDRLSNHALGRALDINTFLNPYVRGEIVAPKGATYDPAHPGAVTPEIAAIFKSRGWRWGGDWTDRKDWQHFEKPA
jgi:hypothetical protein